MIACSIRVGFTDMTAIWSTIVLYPERQLAALQTAAGCLRAKQ